MQTCTPQVTCSQGGTCIAPTTTSATTSPTSISPAGTAAAAAQAAVVAEVAVNLPPQISLNAIADPGPVVHVRHGRPYTVCADGPPPAAEAPCEPGATAIDSDGLPAGSTGSNGSTAFNLTDKVVVCPPAKCIQSGCSPAELQKHYFAAKGLKGCGIDTNAPEGTSFKVSCVMPTPAPQTCITSVAVCCLCSQSACGFDSCYSSNNVMRTTPGSPH